MSKRTLFCYSNSIRRKLAVFIKILFNEHLTEHPLHTKSYELQTVSMNQKTVFVYGNSVKLVREKTKKLLASSVSLVSNVTLGKSRHLIESVNH